MIVAVSKPEIKTATNLSRTPPLPARAGANAGEIIGVVKSIRFREKEFKIFVLEDGTSCRCSNDADDEITPNLTFRFHGKWINHTKYGRQFSVESFSPDTPLNKAGVIAFLIRYCDGIGNITAGKLWDRYKIEALNVLRDNPQEIVAAGFLTIQTAIEVSNTLKFSKECERTRIDLLGLFAKRGFSKKLINECIDVWGARAAEIVRRDPFKLMVAGLSSAGFKRCDKLHCDLQLPVKRLKRQMLSLWYKIRSDNNGHTWHEVQPLIHPKRAIELGRRTGWLRVREPWGAGGWRFIAERDRADNESKIAECVRGLNSWKPTLGDQAGTLWPDEGKIREIEALSPHQCDTLLKAISKPVGVLSGTPGTGKTFTIACLIKLIVQLHGWQSVNIAAPTGKAANRVREAMSNYGVNLAATTIHRLLQVKAGKGGFQFSDNKLQSRFVFIDEASMLDTDLAAALFQALPHGCHVLFVGDVNQLPPVGHGSPLRDLIASGESQVSCGELTEIRRNSGMIVEACANIKDGQPWATATKYEPTLGHNLRHFEIADEKNQAATLLDMLDALAGNGFDPVWDVQILTALNNKGVISRKPLNVNLQNKLNPGGYRVDPNGFRVDDKVICQKNSILRVCALGRGGERHKAEHYKDVAGIGSEESSVKEEFIANGEIGKVLAVGNRQVIVEFLSPSRVCRVLVSKGDEGESDSGDGGESNPHATTPTDGAPANIELAYAITVHKAQGSEAPVVIIPVDESAKTVCSREHVYTAISRAKQLCITVGKMSVLRDFCRRVAIKKRKTFLVEKLQEQRGEQS